jgi:hypothetical protein
MRRSRDRTGGELVGCDEATMRKRTDVKTKKDEFGRRPGKVDLHTVALNRYKEMPDGA